MKLSILELSSSATVRNIRDIYKILGIKEKLVEKAEDKIILLGNGENDDKIIAIILHHLNGKNVVGLAKPIEKRWKIIDVVPSVIRHRKVKKILILMDQENDKIAHIYKNVEGLMRNNFTSFKEKISEYRVKVYECKYGGYKFDLLVVINGIDEIESEYHTIEDHLIMAGNIQIEKGKNSKDAWKKLNKEEKKKIYIKVSKNLKKYVPQQYYACSLLENY